MLCIVHKDVGLRGERQHYRRCFGPLQVEHQRALVAVEVEEDVAHPAVSRGTGIAHDIAFRRFDLDYLGAEIAEDLRRQRPEHDGRQVEHLDPGERPRFGLAHHATRNMIASVAVSSPEERHSPRT